jgi:transcriptional regulator with XRE-family HTH domain
MTTKALGKEDIIKRLQWWREKNGLSQRGAVEVMKDEVGISLSSLQKWEIRKAKPGRFVVKALGRFLDEHAVISNPPRYGRWVDPLPDEKVEEVRKLRENGETLRVIGERFGISESSVWRIAKGDRRAKGATP